MSSWKFDRRARLRLLAGLMASVLLASVLEAQSTTAPAEPLPAGWEEIDQRLVFLTVQLSATEASLAAVKRALAGAKYQQGSQSNRAEAMKAKNQDMDRKGGGPVPWDQFYGTTAQDFYFHPYVSLHAKNNDGSRLDVEKSKAPSVPIQRPPQFNYIYKANVEAARNADSEAAAFGQQVGLTSSS